MDINPVRNGGAAQTVTSVKPAQTSPDTAKRQADYAAVAVKEVAQAINADQRSEEARKAIVDRAAQKLQKLLPSDETFIIFKNPRGEFITRITNKDTGAVRYLPEPKLVQFLDDILGNDSSIVELNA